MPVHRGDELLILVANKLRMRRAREAVMLRKEVRRGEK